MLPFASAMMMQPLGAGGGGGGTMALLMGFDGADASTSFNDESGYSLPVLGSGNAQIDTAQSKFGGSSCYFDGADDRVLIPWVPTYKLGSADFTIEFFVRREVVSGGFEHVAGVRTSTGGSPMSWALTILNDNRLELILRPSATSDYSLTTTTTLGSATWYHVAACRGGNNVLLFLNGVQEATADITSKPIMADVRFPITLGTKHDFSLDFRGWIDEFAITTGVAKYTTNFTPPASAFTRPSAVPPPSGSDPSWSSTKLLCRFNGTHGATSYTSEDTAARTATFTGATCSLSNVVRPMHDSVSLRASSGYVTFPDSDDWAFGTGAFTVECYVYFFSLPTGHIVGQRGSTGGPTAWCMTSVSGQVEVFLNDGTTNTALTTGGVGLLVGTWQHLCLERDASGKTRVYINGAMSASTTTAVNIQNASVLLSIGACANGNLQSDLMMQDLRITKGVARYGSDSGFDPPFRGLLGA